MLGMDPIGSQGGGPGMSGNQGQNMGEHMGMRQGMSPAGQGEFKEKSWSCSFAQA
jgi:hypothetical protein